MDTQARIEVVALKQLREAKAWSQEHLAQAANLSLRTIQRMEAEGVCSAESKLAVAGALEVSPAALSPAAPEIAARTLGHRRGVFWGNLCVVAGALSGAAGIVFGGNSPQDIGVGLGLIGAGAGACCALIGIASHALERRAV
ncbi:MAG: helix-turn-helix transcriptional regulator [Pseudomonadota bacterium]